MPTDRLNVMNAGKQFCPVFLVKADSSFGVWRRTNLSWNFHLVNQRFIDFWIYL